MLRKRFWSILVILLFCLLLSSCQSAEEKKYNKAIELTNSGDYQGSDIVLSELGDYKDARAGSNANKNASQLETHFSTFSAAY